MDCAQAAGMALEGGPRRGRGPGPFHDSGSSGRRGHRIPVVLSSYLGLPIQGWTFKVLWCRRRMNDACKSPSGFRLSALRVRSRGARPLRLRPEAADGPLPAVLPSAPAGVELGVLADPVAQAPPRKEAALRRPRTTYRCTICRRFMRRLGNCGRVNDLLGRVFVHRAHCLRCCRRGHGKDHRHLSWQQLHP